jgi:uncharacterized damage-inducible protein DinB
MSVAPIFEGWQRVQAQLMRRLPELTPEELALRGSPDGWPIWAIVSHIAAVRVYWLCHFCKEPGAETTPFSDPLAEDWEDRLDVPRRTDELMFAVESSWQIVESCLRRWTPAVLDQVFTRVRSGEAEHHTRQSVLTRLVMHDSFHCGEVSVILGASGLPSMDPWAPIA